MSLRNLAGAPPPGVGGTATPTRVRAAGESGWTPATLPLGAIGTTFIEASAGTGKTHALTTLVTRLVAEEGWPLEQLLVVTFTRAATAELRDRIRRTLKAVLTATTVRVASNETESCVRRGRQDPDPQVHALLTEWEREDGFEPVHVAGRLKAALHDIDRANVYTIHGFCQRVLTDLAFESGLPFGFEVSTGGEETVARTVCDLWCRRLYPVSLLLMRYAIKNKFLPDTLSTWVSARRAKTHVTIMGGDPLPQPIERQEATWREVFEAARDGWKQHGEAFREQILEGGWLNRNRYRQPRTDLEFARLEELFLAAEPELPTENMVGRYGRTQLSHACKGNAALPGNPLLDAFDRLEAASRALQAAYDQWLRWTRREIMVAVRTDVRRRVRDARRLDYDDLLIELDNALQGTSGTRLADRIRRAFPCALIDEYQDTDPVQARIFQRIYGAVRATPENEESPEAAGNTNRFGTPTVANSSESAREHLRAGAFIVVGDPKQSVYRFRGADVFAYLAARRTARVRVPLLHNWRSAPGLVQAANAVFASPAPFVVPEIEHRPVSAAQHGSALRVAPGEPRAPLEFWLLPRAREDALLSKRNAKSVVAGAVANEIARLLELAARGAATLAGRPLASADIAVLVRTHHQGRQIADALRSRGVRSVEIDDRSVFDTREAEHLERLLWALAEPGRPAHERGALAGDLFGLDMSALFALNDDEEVWSEWTERLAGWRADWEGRGIGPLLWRLLDKEGGAARLLARGGARGLTNVRHLATLLQEAETQRRLAPVELAAWLSRCRRADTARTDDSVQLRLESDEHLVKILTVHGSKGLEFPVVFCPFAWDAHGPTRPSHSDKTATYHLDETKDYREVLDLNPDERAESIARLEEFSESVRLLYVALTRAKERCVVVWGQVNGAEHAPLTWLLHRSRNEPTAVTDLAAAGVALDAATSRFQTLAAEDWLDEVEAYARRFPNAISTRVLDPEPDTVSTLSSAEIVSPDLAARELGRPLRRTRQMTSFSALSSVVHTAGADLEYAAVEQPDHDQREALSDVVGEETHAAGPAGRERTPFTFPRGPVAGGCLHRIFERLDESSAPESRTAGPPDLDAICCEVLEDFGIEGVWQSVARDMVVRTRAVRLQEPERTGLDRQGTARDTSDAGGARRASSFRLDDAGRRLVELEFHFPVDGLDLERLGTLLGEHGYPNPLVSGGEGELQQIHGFLRGFVDLIVEHAGRWYIVDYKSNWLGPTPADYEPAALTTAMHEGGYSLQYLLYLVALHRYLALRLPGYRYALHVGGVFYLFLRGLDPALGMRRGVYFDRPTEACVRALDDCFRGSRA